MRSSSWQALGNAYVLVEAAGEPLEADRVRVLAQGTDGVLEVVSADTSPLEVVIWNADGSRAELSGNGTRIVATWYLGQTGAREVRIRVGAREVGARLLASGEIEQELGAVDVLPVETIDGVTVTPVLVGNPHAVVIGDPDEIERLGPLLETHPRFPDRTNVQVARVDRPGLVTARVWERGVGETRSSGTSAVAVAAATHDSGEVLVRFPGGELRVTLDQGHARLTAPPATRVA
ncbi:MAG: diaminopimelate epimerase [Gaiellaceae bacterium]